MTENSASPTPLPAEEPDALKAGYEDIAERVLSDINPNIHSGMNMSNRDLCNYICVQLGWEDFDILDALPFEQMYAMGDLNQSRAYMFLAFLKHAVCRQALAENHGDKTTNIIVLTYCELWHRKLMDKVTAMLEKRKLQHTWIN